MLPDEEHHQTLAEAAQRASKEKEQYNTEVRQHVVGIAVDLGEALWASINITSGNPVHTGTIASYWKPLANKICDFTEFLDAA